jgi:hypothetical protein
MGMGRGKMEKRDETGNPPLLAVEAFARWLREENTSVKPRNVLDIVARQTAEALRRGDAPPVFESASLMQHYLDDFGGTVSEGTIASKWLRRAEIVQWWMSRQRSAEQALRRANCTVSVQLRAEPGGGRGNQGTYSLTFPAMPDVEEAELPIDSPAERGSVTDPMVFEVRYTKSAAQAAWVLRWLSKEPFRMRSWRGRLLVGLLLTALLGVAVPLFLLTTTILTAWHPLGRGGITLCAFLATLMAWLLRSWAPLWKLPWQRLTVATDELLALSQDFGQFQLTRDKTGEGGGWFACVCHWAPCPICAARINIQEGAPSFPGRLVGRCGDEPREHVFSFDAVTLTGTLLVSR